MKNSYWTNKIVQEIQNKLGNKILIQRMRLNANLALKNNSSKHDWHIDLAQFKKTKLHKMSKSMIVYLNTNNGYTEFKEGKVESLSNRAVIFNSSLIHRGVWQSDAPIRYVLNIVYVPWV